MNETITVNVASIPGRGLQLYRTVKSLLPQCDHINIALNVDQYVGRGYERLESNYNALYKLFQDPKVNYIISDNTLGDGARYLFDNTGWLLTVDDDIEYPPTYVQDMIEGGRRYWGSIITLHGAVMKPGPRESLYGPNDRLRAYRCLAGVSEDVRVEIAGTGVMCFHSDIFKVDLSRFERRNMADLWVAVLAHEKGIPIICLAHELGYLTYTLPTDKFTIHGASFWDKELAKYQAGIINKYLR